MQRISYGHLLTVQSCAAEKGVHHRIWSYDESGVPPVNRGEFGDWIMTVENAEEWGYLAAPDTRLDPAGMNIENEFGSSTLSVVLGVHAAIGRGAEPMMRHL